MNFSTFAIQSLPHTAESRCPHFYIDAGCWARRGSSVIPGCIGHSHGHQQHSDPEASLFILLLCKFLGDICETFFWLASWVHTPSFNFFFSTRLSPLKDSQERSQERTKIMDILNGSPDNCQVAFSPVVQWTCWEPTAWCGFSPVVTRQTPHRTVWELVLLQPCQYWVLLCLSFCPG